MVLILGEGVLHHMGVVGRAGWIDFMTFAGS